MAEPLLQLQDITKIFPGVKALDKVSFDLKKGEVHVLLGENGAGKSTLMKIISGVYHPTSGQLFYKGKPVSFADALESQHAGISIIYQELNLIPHLTVAQNIFIGREPLIGGFIINEKKLNKDASEILARLNLPIAPTLCVNQLTISKQQIIEVAKAISYKAEVLIMDEPTSALSKSEIDELFKLIRQLRNEGVGIIYISHRLEELKEIADRVTVLRDGKLISTHPFKELSIDELVQKMVGRTLNEKFPPRTSVPTKEKILEVSHISRRGVLDDISFSLYKGEVLGISGLMGAGRTELARAIFGADSIDKGEVLLAGNKVDMRSPVHTIRGGLAYLSEDRKGEGLAIEMQLAENISLANTVAISNKLGVLHLKKEKEIAQKYINDLSIRTPSATQLVKNLSGGNQQKVVVAKWLFRDAKVLLFDEPTRGIDVGAKFAIYELIDRLAREGVGVIIISSELPEILGITDRVLVLHAGKLVATLNTKETDQEEILNYAAGLARSSEQNEELIKINKSSDTRN